MINFTDIMKERLETRIHSQLHQRSRVENLRNKVEARIWTLTTDVRSPGPFYGMSLQPRGPIPWESKNDVLQSKRNKAGYTANTSCGRVGRGGNAGFPTFQLDHSGPTDGRMDGRTKPLIELRVRN